METVVVLFITRGVYVNDGVSQISVSYCLASQDRSHNLQKGPQSLHNPHNLLQECYRSSGEELIKMITNNRLNWFGTNLLF